MTVYADLQVTTHFSFLRGASSPAELFEQAKLLGISALGITDRNSLAGIVRAYEASKDTGVRLVVGCRLDLTDGTSLLVYPTNRPAYSRLCRLLSIGKSRGGKGKCFLTWDDLAQWSEGLLSRSPKILQQLSKPEVFGHHASLATRLLRRQRQNPGCGISSQHVDGRRLPVGRDQPLELAP